MKVFSADYLDELTASAKKNPRIRQHRNIHESYNDPCQRLFNAIEPESYIQPHRHSTDPREELLVAVRGSLALLLFDDQGVVTEIVRFGTGRTCAGLAAGVEVPSDKWHTVLALESGCILLEVKAGPFDPSQPKDLAEWAPPEGTVEANSYLHKLIEELIR